ADSFPWFLQMVNEAADVYRFRRIEEVDREALRGYDARRIIRHLQLPMWKVPLVARWMRRRMAGDISTIRLFPGVTEMLRRLDEVGVLIAVVSSNAEANVRHVLGAENAARVRHFGCGASLFGKRPLLRRALRACGVPPGAVIAIGDEVRDLEAARAERIAFGAVAWGFTRLDALAARGPEEIFDSVDDIAERVSRRHVAA
ncbi:MAG: HAD hydrolase-like protein, partial [Gemmatimonadetes bacterium]|nr:HAD hydrolase-like protein [Gemmatimonadota bacterium]